MTDTEVIGMHTVSLRSSLLGHFSTSPASNHVDLIRCDCLRHLRNSFSGDIERAQHTSNRAVHGASWAFQLSPQHVCLMHKTVRMSPFTSLKSRHTVMGIGPLGIQKSRRLLDCETITPFTRPCLLVAPSYILTVLLKSVFVFKCRLPTLRLTPLLTLLLLPLAATRLLCYHKRIRPPPSVSTPTLDAVVLSAFPIAWFFGFLYYTDVPSLLSVIVTIVAASQGKHWFAGLVRDVRAPRGKVARQS
jgi:DIE2/ALG10 family